VRGCDRPRDAYAGRVDLLADERQELELRADVTGIAVLRAVDAKDEARVAHAHLEHGVVEEPDRCQLRVRRKVVRLESRSRERLLPSAQGHCRLTCTGAPLPRQQGPRSGVARRDV
jgi:hypothetical protein